ncbi:hypothetical protein [Bradyrhizobium uaiense]|uniref:Uncharacterized protein n=1 Tax=Bradyrhizobium uaiense TaxID=2594946 RepID=A0A6P1BEC4_9BRAD|nr:hypothetical protein [Bradyrhizobium uaiense]NEU96649.1 hypothetical protein [Bradyrhizobium uaiense]
MPVARYFLFVGGVLLALLFVVNAIVPQEAVVASQNQSLSSPAVDNKTVVRIKSVQKLPERVVYDTSLPTIVPSQVNAVAAAAPPATGDASAEARVRNTFAQFIPPEKADTNKVVAEAKPAEQPAPAQPQAPKKRKVAHNHNHYQQPMRFAQPGMYQPYRVAQQQPRMGFFGGFGTW